MNREQESQKSSGNIGVWCGLVAVVMAAVTLWSSTAGEAFGADSGQHLSTADFLRREIRVFSGCEPEEPLLFGVPSRMSGTPGCDRAAEYVKKRFRELGLENISEQVFDVVVPITKHCSMSLRTAAGETPVELYPLYPNWVQTSSTPGPVTAPVVYAGDGDLRKLDGLPLNGSIVILEHNTGAAWQTIASFGPVAILFVEPEKREATRRQAEMKILSDPVNMPRFWVPRTVGAGTKRLGAGELVAQVVAAQTAARGKTDGLLVATIDSLVNWEKRQARNIFGFLPGAEGTADKGHFLAFSAHYDSMSIAPDLAPGADASSSIAVLLRLADRLQQNRPAEGVLFIATAGHYQGLRGAAFLADSIRLSSSILNDGSRKQVDELKDRVRALSRTLLPSDNIAAECDDLARRIEALDGLPAETQDEMLARVDAIRKMGMSSGGKATSFGASAGRTFAARAATLDNDPGPELEKLLLLLESDALSARIRTLEDKVIKKRARMEAYDALAERVRTTSGLQPAVAESMLAKVTALRKSVSITSSPKTAYKSLLALVDEARGSEIIVAETEKQLRSAISVEQERTDGVQFTGASFEQFQVIIGALERDLRNTAMVAAEILAQIRILKRDLTRTTSSQAAYNRIFALLKEAEGLTPANRRRLRFEVEHQRDADRHLIQHRFELLRLRQHKAFLDNLGIDLQKRLRMVYSLELCGDGQRFGVFAAGDLVAQNVADQVIYGGLMQRIWHIGRKRVEGGPVEPGKEPPQYERIIYPARVEDRLGGYFSGMMAYDSEMIQLAGREALAFATVDAARRRVDTPTDTADRMEKYGSFDRLAFQSDVLCELVQTMSTDSQVRNIYRSLDQKRLGRNSPLLDYMCRVNGRVVLYDMRESIATADVPVAGALCVSRFSRSSQYGLDVGSKSYAGVRDGIFTFSDEAGTFEHLGIPHDKARAWNAKGYYFEAFKFNERGAIRFAPDLGPQGAVQYKLLHNVARADWEVTVPVFECRPVSLFGFTDPLVGRGFTGFTVLDAKTNTTPDFYGRSFYPQPRTYTHGVPSGVVYLQPGAARRAERPGPTSELTAPTTKFKLQFTSGVLGATLPLLNVRGDSEEILNKDGEMRGAGYTIPETEVLANCRYLMTRDVVNLDEYRIKALARHAVENNRVNELHYGKKGPDGRVVSEGATQRLERATRALAERRYGAYQADIEAALAMEARAYPIIKGTTTDILSGVLFYLFLLLPFSYFAERLLFGFPSINKRIAGFFGIFIVVFLLLALVHPAFAITKSAPVILISFITMALSLLVISMIRGRFELEVKRLHERPGSRRPVDFRRAGATTAACALGIGNMRRRKVRTTLTLATLVLLTFSVLSFTSVDPRQVTHENPNPTGEDIRPPYPGVLLRDFRYAPLGQYLFDLVSNEFAEKAIIVPRAWLGTDALVQSAANRYKDFLCTGVVGLTPEEEGLTVSEKEHLRAGRWFAHDDPEPACIIGQKVAQEVGIQPEQVTGVIATAPRIRLLGVELPVIGLTQDDRFRKVKDIDGEELSPVDMRKERWEKRSGKSFDPYAVESYIHVEPENCVFVPFSFLMEYGANLMSIAIVPKEREQDMETASKTARAIGESLLTRLTIPIYISADGSVTYVVSSDANRVRGLGAILVPMLICALIVLNTMLGSVYERQREISIFGSLGLAPLHIGSLFVAESAVFATIAVIIGYVLGQATSFLLTANKLLEGFSLNYSSTSAVISAAAVMALVLLSTIYPARKASQLSVPDVERIWKLPAPVGDVFDIHFPFNIGGEHAFGINMFLLEYFNDHANQSIGDFFAQETGLRLENVGGTKVMRFDSQVWIAPFDFGISQTVTMHTMPTDEVGVYAPVMRIERKSGAPAAWARMNHRFLKLIRQQFLLWRILTPEERNYFAAQARVHLGTATDADRRTIETFLKSHETGGGAAADSAPQQTKKET